MRARWTAALLLTLGLPALPRAGAAQGKPYSLEDIVTLVSSGVRPVRVIELARAGCLSFVLTPSVDARLRNAGADPMLADSLRGICYRGSALEVLSDPAGAEVYVAGRRIGQTPLVTPWAPATGVGVEVRGAMASRSVTVDVPADRLVRVSVMLPQDTLPHADDAGVPGRPQEPIAPGPRSRIKPALFGAIVGGGAGYAAGSGACSSKELNYRFDPDLGYNVPASGSGIEDKAGTGCAIGIAAGGAAAGWLLSETWSRWQHRRRMARYERDRDSYPARLQAYEAAMAAGGGQGVAEQNQRIRARNESLGNPQVTTEPARRLTSAAPTP